MNKEKFTSTKYCKSFGSWCSQNVGEMHIIVEQNVIMFSKTLPKIQEHTRVLNTAPTALHCCLSGIGDTLWY